MIERVPEYERTSGFNVRSDWNEHEVPVPPSWVREQAGVPERFAYASFAEEVSDYYHPTLLEVCTKYVRRYPVENHHGKAPVLLGSSGFGKSWAAAAIVNEILMRFGNRLSITTEWLSVQWRLEEIMELHKFHRREQYFDVKKRLRTCDLLVVDDLLHVPEYDYSKTKGWLLSLFEFRFENRKPTIVTANATVEDDDWGDISDVFSEPFVRRLRDVSEGFVVVL